MDNKVVSAKGRLSPEYKTITKNFRTLASILELPINNSVAAIELVEAELISSSGITTGKDMVDSVLKYVEFDAMKFYKFLAVLQNLSSTESIFKQLHQVFFGKSIGAEMSDSDKKYMFIFDRAIAALDFI